MSISIKAFFVDLRLGGDLAFDLIRLRTRLVGTGSYGPTTLSPSIRTAKLSDGTSIVLDVVANTAQIGDSDVKDLTDPVQFADFMGEVDLDILTANPGFPSIGFLIADEIAHFLHTVNRRLGYAYPYQHLLPEALDLQAGGGAWQPNRCTDAFLDEIGKDGKPHRWHDDFVAGKRMPSPNQLGERLSLQVRWLEQVDAWMGNEFSVHRSNVWPIGGFFWQRIDSAPTLIAAEMVMHEVDAPPIRGSELAAVGRSLEDGLDHYALRLAFGGTFIMVDVNREDGSIQAWAHPSFVNGIFENETVRLMAFLENEILPKISISRVT